MSAVACSLDFCSASYNRAASVQLTTACSKLPLWNEFKPCSICPAAGEDSAIAAADAGFADEIKGLPTKFNKRPSTSVLPRRQGWLILNSLPKRRGDIHVFPPVREVLM